MDNTALPGLGILDTYFRSKAKKKIVSDFTNMFEEKYSGAKDKNELMSLSQGFVKEIYANDLLDSQDQASLLQLSTNMRTVQDNFLTQRAKDTSALALTDTVNQMSGGEQFKSNSDPNTYGTENLSSQQILDQVKSKLGANATPEDILNLYAKTLDLSKLKDKSSGRVAKEGIYFQRFKLDSEGQGSPIGSEFLANEKNVNTLTPEEREMYNAHKSGLYKDQKEFNEWRKKTGISFDLQIQKEEARAERSEKKVENKEYEKAVFGKDIDIRDPNNPHNIVKARYHFKEDSKKTKEQNLEDLKSGSGEWEVIYDGKIIKNPVLKVNTDKMTENEKLNRKVDVFREMKAWEESGSDLFDDFFDDTRYELIKTQLNSDLSAINNYNGEPIERSGAKSITDEMLNDLVATMNRKRMSGKLSPEDEAFLNNLGRLMGQNQTMDSFIDRFKAQ